jgi:hypothetical protein
MFSASVCRCSTICIDVTALYSGMTNYTVTNGESCSCNNKAKVDGHQRETKLFFVMNLLTKSVSWQILVISLVID